MGHTSQLRRNLTGWEDRPPAPRMPASSSTVPISKVLIPKHLQEFLNAREAEAQQQQLRLPEVRQASAGTEVGSEPGQTGGGDVRGMVRAAAEVCPNCKREHPGKLVASLASPHVLVWRCVVCRVTGEAPRNPNATPSKCQILRWNGSAYEDAQKPAIGMTRASDVHHCFRYERPLCLEPVQGCALPPQTVEKWVAAAEQLGRLVLADLPPVTNLDWSAPIDIEAKEHRKRIVQEFGARVA